MLKFYYMDFEFTADLLYTDEYEIDTIYYKGNPINEIMELVILANPSSADFWCYLRYTANDALDAYLLEQRREAQYQDELDTKPEVCYPY